MRREISFLLAATNSSGHCSSPGELLARVVGRSMVHRCRCKLKNMGTVTDDVMLSTTVVQSELFGRFSKMDCVRT